MADKLNKQTKNLEDLLNQKGKSMKNIKDELKNLIIIEEKALYQQMVIEQERYDLYEIRCLDKLDAIKALPKKERDMLKIQADMYKEQIKKVQKIRKLKESGKYVGENSKKNTRV